MAGIFDNEYIQQAARQLMLGAEIQLNHSALQPLKHLFSQHKLFAIVRGDRVSLTPQGKQYFRQQMQQATTVEHDDPEADLLSLHIALPAIVNQQVIASLLQRDRLSSLSQATQALLADTQLTASTDDILRIRAETAFSLYLTDGSLLDLSAMLKLSNEVALSQRMLMGISKVLPANTDFQYVITVQQLGAFIEMPMKPQCIYLYCPDEQSALAHDFLKLLPASIKWYHFADLAQDSINQAKQLAVDTGRPCKPLIPRHFKQAIRFYAKPVADSGKSAWQLSTLSPELAARLAPLIENELWLEQEVLIYCL
ncbi:hypothetical protein [Motilimonas pumila]|uniref:Uncharacterized protein n=1 Tax=Motilimonas pumila TaxID=2303987 RepID=A0A418YFG3_9GAMM|nr:hypothetical protein [Motilimonas pumila]RJG48115.1 hypothetical protein D1Z90_08560 [Motilimonas pumila]